VLGLPMESWMIQAANYVVEIIRTTAFDRQVRNVLTEDAITGLMKFIARSPEGGDVIPGTGGVRKMRWAMKGRGKRRGARVIYFYRDLNMPVYLLAAYAKSEKVDVSVKEKKELREMVEYLVLHHGELIWENIVRIETKR
jgi:hypothetical protein